MSNSLAQETAEVAGLRSSFLQKHKAKLSALLFLSLLGGSFGTLDELVAGNVQVNPLTLVASVVLILISISLYRFIKKREASEKLA